MSYLNFDDNAKKIKEDRKRRDPNEIPGIENMSQDFRDATVNASHMAVDEVIIILDNDINYYNNRK